MRRNLWALVFSAVLAGFSTVFVVSPAAAQFDQFYAFGDSTIDTGWFRNFPQPPNPPLHNLALASLADGGRIPNTPFGLGAAQVLAAHFGLLANPVNQPGGGTNYAAGGAQTNANFINAFAPSVTSQISTYLTTHAGLADPNALYLFNAGGNDLKYASTLAPAARIPWVTNAASQASTLIAMLQTVGAQTILVANGYTTTLPPGPLTTAYYNALFSDLSGAGVNFIKGDFQSIQAQIFADPLAYGFTSISNVDGPNGTALINPNSSVIPTSWAYYGTTALLRSPNAAQTSFWADNEHLAAAAQKLEGDYFYSLIIQPVPELSTWAMMLLGFAGIGFVAYRKSRAPIALASKNTKRCTVLPVEPNAWFISMNGRRVAGPFATNSAAWEWVDAS